MRNLCLYCFRIADSLLMYTCDICTRVRVRSLTQICRWQNLVLSEVSERTEAGEVHMQAVSPVVGKEMGEN